MLKSKRPRVVSALLRGSSTKATGARVLAWVGMTRNTSASVRRLLCRDPARVITLSVFRKDFSQPPDGAPWKSKRELIRDFICMARNCGQDLRRGNMP